MTESGATDSVTKIAETQALENELAAICELLADRHAVDATSIETPGHEAIADAIIVCGATSRRHAQGLADGVASLCREKGYEFLGMEGYEPGEWILLDLNNIILHIFQEEPRRLYRLEELWGSRMRHSGGKNDADTSADS